MSKDLKDIVYDINKITGDDIAILGDSEKNESIEFMPTGIMQLDDSIGGGFPRGRITEINGLPSTAKSSLCLQFVKKAQQEGHQCIYIDTEYALDLDFAAKLGIELDKMIMVRPNSGEEVFSTIDKLLRDDFSGVIIVDSTSGIVPRGDIEAEAGKYMIGSQAKLISMELRKLVGPLSKNKATLVFISQLRMNILGGQYDPYTTPGGMSLKFYTSLSIQLKKTGVKKKGEETIGMVIEVKVKKNKVSRPNGRCELTFMFDEGFSTEDDVLNLGEAKGIIKIEGNTYYYKEQKLGVGINRARDFLKKNPTISSEILQELTIQK